MTTILNITKYLPFVLAVIAPIAGLLGKDKSNIGERIEARPSWKGRGYRLTLERIS